MTAARVAPASGFVTVQGRGFVDGDGAPLRLRGIGIGGWLNMENFITGYPANESLMRAAVVKVLGPDRAELFFDRLLTAFFGEADARLLASVGLNLVRLPVNYRHLEDDARPLVLRESGFRHLDRAIKVCADQGIYSLIDLHSVPGYQNHHWHCDNPTHQPMLWDHPHFQDRTVHLWEAIADRYKDHPWVVGYNPINEPADESRAVLGPFYRRLASAIRAVDPRHALFLDGNTYSTEFDIFGQEPWDNTVFVCHDYARPGFADGGPYPGKTADQWCDQTTLERSFRNRSEFSRRTGTPVFVGEFGPVYSGDPRTDEHRLRVLADQLELYRREEASWAIWTYKDLGLQGLVTVRPDTAYQRRFGPVIDKKHRLGADAWGTTGVGDAAATEPFQRMMRREFGDFTPYPWGLREWTRTLLLNITVAQALVEEYAGYFAGLDDAELLALADSFALERCDPRPALRDQLAAG